MARTSNRSARRNLRPRAIIEHVDARDHRVPRPARRVRPVCRSLEVRGQGQVRRGLPRPRVRGPSYGRFRLRQAQRAREVQEHCPRPQDGLHAQGVGLRGVRQVRGGVPREGDQARSGDGTDMTPCPDCGAPAVGMHAASASKCSASVPRPTLFMHGFIGWPWMPTPSSTQTSTAARRSPWPLTSQVHARRSTEKPTSNGSTTPYNGGSRVRRRGAEAGRRVP